MNSEKHVISSVPTNIITGFLGVGKTTIILNLLKRKPANQRWAILVNEFGEVGIDGGLFQGQHKEAQGVFIREVPGGCMCCAAGLPMQIALNQLLTRAKPDRLLIEPTGLGHPKEVLAVLSADHYQDVLNIQQSITLVDARKISDPRYTEHDTFNQQIDIADQIVGHKADLYSDGDRESLIHYVVQRQLAQGSSIQGQSTQGQSIQESVTQQKPQNIPIHFVQRGDVDPVILQGESAVIKNLKHHGHAHQSELAPNINDQEIPACGFLRVENAGEGFQSLGWRFSPQKIFNRQSLQSWIKGLNVERVKGVFITRDGIFGYNATQGELTETELDDCFESRVEIIGFGESQASEEGLLQCLDNKQ